MPRLIGSATAFLKLEKESTECRVVRRRENVKLKLRTSKGLATYVTTPDEAESLLKSVKVKVVEL